MLRCNGMDKDGLELYKRSNKRDAMAMMMMMLMMMIFRCRRFEKC